jgi:hypothetical protein
MIIDCAHYQDGRRTDEKGVPLPELAARRTEGGFVWLGLFEPDKAELDHVRDLFGLHELAVEDALSMHMRPKTERYDPDIQLVILRTARYDEAAEEVEFGEISIFLAPTFIITVLTDEEVAAQRDLLGTIPPDAAGAAERAQRERASDGEHQAAPRRGERHPGGHRAKRNRSETGRPYHGALVAADPRGSPQVTHSAFGRGERRFDRNSWQSANHHRRRRHGPDDGVLRGAAGGLGYRAGQVAGR